MKSKHNFTVSMKNCPFFQAKNVRFQMIQLRKNKVQEFKNYRMIPITEKEIPRGLLEAREKRLVQKLDGLKKQLRTFATHEKIVSWLL